MVNLNWNIFNAKYSQREQKAFEDLSYLLFCAEFNNRIGLFRYKNQIGGETEPIVKDGIVYSFQAKYYTTPISKNKNDIIDSIRKIKNKNMQLNKIFFYTNQEFSESTKTRKKKPQYQIDIEAETKKLNIEIEWRVKSHFEIQLSLPENKYIHDLFFELNPNSGNLIDEVQKHNDNLLQTIQKEIIYNNFRIKIDRNDIITKIRQIIDDSQHFILSGEGGCGKTAILKEFYENNKQLYPICIFKANELNVSNINDIFRFDNYFTLNQFLELYKSETKKIFVIDSAEKMVELNNIDILQNLINSLIRNHWIIVFTTRYSYLNDLSFIIKDNYHLSYSIIDIPILNNKEIIDLSEKYGFSLPENQKFTERLQNLFYLNEYIQELPNIDKKGNFRSFVNLIWKKRIQNIAYQKDNIHIERENSFLFIAKERCRTGSFYINADKLSQPALFQLKQNEILGYDENHNGYFITHDIYEEWALEKIITRCYANIKSSKLFFYELGDTLPIRRAFRLWLSEQLSDNIDNIKDFIGDTITNNDILQHWKDELLVSILLSNFADDFFKQFEKDIIADNFIILNRILFLLKIACKEDNSLQGLSENKDFGYFFIKPKGKGWDVVVSFVYKYKDNYLENNMKLIISILADWINNFKEGKTTRYAGLLALELFEKKVLIKDFHISDNIEQSLIKIILGSSGELKSELKHIFDKITADKQLVYNSPYEKLCSVILNKPVYNIETIKTLPLSVIQLCNFFWREKEERNIRYGMDYIEKKYGLVSEYQFNYFPASALQTPIYFLLNFAFIETLDFIIDFTNNSVEKYRNSDYGKEDVKEITLHINEKEIKQYFCWAFWGMYRGISSPVTPYLLQSIHMALEKFLLEYAKINANVIEQILLLILTKSKSASLTAVVCSIVLAEPDKFYNIALILFKTIELFNIDTQRQLEEAHAKSLYGIGYGTNKEDDAYNNERLETCKDKHRNTCLETLFINYEFFGINGAVEEESTIFIQKLYNIIDQHKIAIQDKSPEEQNTFGILLARMDRRTMKFTVKNHNNAQYIMEIKPKLPSELREQSNKSMKQLKDKFKYTDLLIWSDIDYNKNNHNQNYDQYDKDPGLALKKTKQLIKNRHNDTSISTVFLNYSIPAFVCSKLMIQYKAKLTENEKKFCKNIIIESISVLFSDNYRYQISDGVEACTHAIPSLMAEYHGEKELFTKIMIFILFDITPIGSYKRICDYAVESIHEAKLWENTPDDAQTILFGFIKLKPIFNQIYSEKKKTPNKWGRISKSEVIIDLEKKITEKYVEFSFINLSFDIQNVTNLNIEELEIIYQLIPSNTKDITHLDIYKNTLPIIASRLLKNRNQRSEENIINIYSLRHHFFGRIADFLLERSLNEIDIYLQPFIDSFDATEETAAFLKEIIIAEDYNNRYEQFWYIWNKLYPKFIEINKNLHKYHLDTVVNNYLLSQNWKESAAEWHSLKRENLSFYENIVKDTGNNPSVLYSISKVLNSIGSNFISDGINWIHAIISENKSLELGDLEVNTLFYLEKIMRKFIFIYKEKIKHEFELKNKVVLVLNFMIERGSVHGYLLRENAL
jgi:hypothetical protein